MGGVLRSWQRFVFIQKGVEGERQNLQPYHYSNSLQRLHLPYRKTENMRIWKITSNKDNLGKKPLLFGLLPTSRREYNHQPSEYKDDQSSLNWLVKSRLREPCDF